MIRQPLRPLTRILQARAKGESTEAIERENRRHRHEEMREKMRGRAALRLKFLAFCFFAAFSAIGGQMAVLASSDAEEPTIQSAEGPAPILSDRADIVDRNGRVLATNMETYSLYAQPQQMIDPHFAADELARIFPELDHERLVADFTGDRRFLWIRRQISPEQMQQVHDIGDPGLLFGPRQMRLYPNGSLAAHILGGSSYGREGVSSAEVIGVAGVERYFDARLRDPYQQDPLELSLDLTVQAVMEEVLGSGMVLMNAKGASGIIMDVYTGEIVAMASLPDFDPNDRPALPTSGSPADSPLFNRSLQGVYELGSVFKAFTAAAALDAGLVNPNTIINTEGPLTWGRFRISDSHRMDPSMPVSEVIAESSNVGTARIAQMLGIERQKAFLDSLGMLEPTQVEMAEAPTGRPQFPENWSELSMMTISYGHGLAVSPLHLAAGYATIANGGTRIVPTLLRQDGPQVGERIISRQTSDQIRSILRGVVSHGTASLAEVPGYNVGGKTGTAEKPIETGGGYYSDKVIATFSGIFPANDPRYVIIISLDEPVETSGPQPRRTAGWTAVPVAAEVIRRTAPLMGLRPAVERWAPESIHQASQ
ncbi:peptidoglycan D,D-transpeptidase FtsI family protein [Pseudoroseicyclus tamaricis]|uniref:Penicillin-binding protein 2 n=1 Tax=Pseudoroseicyclus tamaricis TaxID=2705421 RepID=A0A6B2JQQ2_9RHOB|nr:penicillin-binding protein 2 [Pseudoroseicyclus tamaricis]NDV00360.1 penicillin-binding protein 2 [Pseudoroseicyclus tamaricis]